VLTAEAVAEISEHDRAQRPGTVADPESGERGDQAHGRDDYVGVLTVSGPSFRFTRDVAVDVLPTIKYVAEQLSHIPSEELLGFSAPAKPSAVERNGHSLGAPEMERLAQQRNT
jgi:hypothetical protein